MVGDSQLTFFDASYAVAEISLFAYAAHVSLFVVHARRVAVAQSSEHRASQTLVCGTFRNVKFKKTIINV